MKRFETYEEYIEITKKYRRYSDYKNVYFLKNQVQGFIESQKLSYEETGRNLYIFEKCDGFSRFFYYINKDEPAEKIQIGEPLVIEFVYDEPVNEKMAETIDYLQKLGFELGRRSIRMTLHNLSDFKYDMERYSINEIEIGFADDSDAEMIRALLDANFDPKYSYIPSLEDLRKIIQEERILVARHNGEIAAIEHFEISKKVLKCWHMLVAPEYQGQGIGWSLFSEVHRITGGRAVSGQIWLREDNLPAAALYQSGGYESDYRRSDEYILI